MWGLPGAPTCARGPPHAFWGWLASGVLGIPLKYTLQRLGCYSPLPKRRPQKTLSAERKNKIVSRFTALASSGGGERLVHGFGVALAPGGLGEMSAGLQTPHLPHTWGFA